MENIEIFKGSAKYVFKKDDDQLTLRTYEFRWLVTAMERYFRSTEYGGKLDWDIRHRVRHSFFRKTAIVGVGDDILEIQPLFANDEGYYCFIIHWQFQRPHQCLILTLAEAKILANMNRDLMGILAKELID